MECYVLPTGKWLPTFLKMIQPSPSGSTVLIIVILVFVLVLFADVVTAAKSLCKI